MVKRVLQSKLFRDNSIFFIGSIIAAFFNYLLYPVLSRIVDVTSFGEVQVLVSFSVQLTMFFEASKVTIVNVIANEENTHKATVFMQNMERLMMQIGLVGVVAGLLAAPILQDFLQFRSPVPIILLTTALIGNILRGSRSAYIRGKSDFSYTSIIEIVGAACRVVAAAALGALFGTSGAIIGIAIALAIATILSAHYTQKLGLELPLRHYLKISYTLKQTSKKFLKKHIGYMLLVGVIAIMVPTLVSLDSVMVKHYFSPETAGFYAGVSTIARTIFFLTTSVTAVLLSSIKLKASHKDNLKTYVGSVGLIIALGTSGLACFYLMPELIVKIMIGSDYAPYAYLLPPLGLVLLGISLINLIFAYHLAVRDFTIAIIAMSGSVFTILLLISNHDSLEAIIDGMKAGVGSLLAASLLWTIWWNLQRKQKNVFE